MNVPEVEVRSFKQQGGESLKDAWYRICDAHHRCTKKYSTMILGIESLVGVPPTNVSKTKITLEEVVKRLNSLKKIVPNLLYDATQTNELIGIINKRITV